jgi:hypothetical protein
MRSIDEAICLPLNPMECEILEDVLEPVERIHFPDVHNEAITGQLLPVMRELPLGDIPPLHQDMQVHMPATALIDRLDRIQPSLPSLLVGLSPTQLLPGFTYILNASLQALSIPLGQGHELEPMLAQLLKLWRIGVVEAVKVDAAKLKTTPLILCAIRR